MKIRPVAVSRFQCFIALAAAVCLLMTGRVAWAGSLQITVTGKDGKPLPCRIHLTDAAGQPVRAAGLPFWKDHFVCQGTAKVSVEAGKHKLEVERGPEFERYVAVVTVGKNADGAVAVTLKRIGDLSATGWHSGDLHVHRNPEEVELLMQAEDLDVAPVITWWNNRNLWKDRALPKKALVRFDGNRYYHLLGGEDEREGGALLYFGLDRPLEITGSSREYPSPMKFVLQAHQNKRVWIDIEKPFWWDVPIWLASGKMHSIGLANNHMCRSRMYESEAWGRPRDEKRLPAPRGNGFWTQEIYYHILNCGFRLPPSAGSASGVLPNPVGYNRVYVHTGKKLDYDDWWKGLKAGRSFVTNGPLLIVKADDHLPGHVFQAKAGARLEIPLSISLTTLDDVPALEIIKNGRVDRRISLKEAIKEGVDSVTFKESGWFLVRAIADHPRTFRFASTAPFYVEVGKTKRRISRQSAKFFIDWVAERAKRVPIKLSDLDKQQEVLIHHVAADKFWKAKLAAANAD